MNEWLNEISIKKGLNWPELCPIPKGWRSHYDVDSHMKHGIISKYTKIILKLNYKRIKMNLPFPSFNLPRSLFVCSQTPGWNPPVSSFEIISPLHWLSQATSCWRCLFVCFLGGGFLGGGITPSAMAPLFTYVNSCLRFATPGHSTWRDRTSLWRSGEEEQRDVE